MLDILSMAMLGHCSNIWLVDRYLDIIACITDDH